MAAQFEAVATACRVRAGDRLSWHAQVERCLQVVPEPGERDAYAEAHAALARLLPGTAPLVERYERHRRSTLVAPERLAVALDAVIALLRSRTPGLPADEGLRLEVVVGAPWAALCRSVGPRSSHVLVDGARPLPAASLVGLAAHETYPGHHTERCLLAGLPERAVAIAATPEAVVTEGLGETALRASGVTVQECGPLLGQDLSLAGAVAEAARPLAGTKTDAALLLHTRGAVAARAHLLRWGLHSPTRADAQLAFLGDPRWAVHAVAYGAGARLVGRWLDAGRPYAALLGRDVLPADLAAPAG